MSMKRWVYVGTALIVGNATLLGGVRPGEILPASIYRQPLIENLRYRFSGIASRKPKPMVSPVSVRLFANEKPKGVWLKNLNGFLLGERRIKGTLLIELQDGLLKVYRSGHYAFAAQEL